MRKLNRLKDIREAKSMSQEDLAEKSGVSRATISSLENQKDVDVLAGTLVKIAKALEVSVVSIFFTDEV